MTSWGNNKATEETKERTRSRSRDKDNKGGAAAFGDGDQVALKMRGVPYRASQEEIEEFFADFKLVADGIKFGVADDGRKNGFAAALFESEDQAKEAQEAKDKQEIGSRWIGLSQISYSEYKDFGNPDAVKPE